MQTRCDCSVQICTCTSQWWILTSLETCLSWQSFTWSSVNSSSCPPAPSLVSRTWSRWQCRVTTVSGQDPWLSSSRRTRSRVCPSLRGWTCPTTTSGVCPPPPSATPPPSPPSTSAGTTSWRCRSWGWAETLTPATVRCCTSPAWTYHSTRYSSISPSPGCLKILKLTFNFCSDFQFFAQRSQPRPGPAEP